MPAALASMDGFVRSCMNISSHILNEHASANVDTCRADFNRRCLYKRNVARRGIPKQPPAWFLREWMAAVGMDGRGAQAKMMEKTGWTKATMSLLYNGQQDLNSDYIRAAAAALQIREHELFMHPAAAYALRKFQESAREVARVEPTEAPLRLVDEDRKSGTND